MVISNFMTSVAFYFMITALPVYLTTDLMFGKDQAGIIIAAYIFTAVLIRPFVGVFIDNYGRRTIYLGALFLFSSLFVAYGLVTTQVALITVRVIHGFLWGVLTTAGNTLILDFVPSDKRGEGLGYYGLAFTMSMAIGPLLSSIIIQKSNYLVLFALASIVALIGTALLLGLKFPKHISSKTSIKDGLMGFVSPKAIPIAILTFLILMPYGAVLNFIAIYCKTVNSGSTVVFFLSLAFGLTISRIFAGRKFDQNGPFRLLIISYFFIFCSFPILIVYDSSFTLALSALFIGIGFGISFPVYQLMLNNVLPVSMRSTANSLFLTAIDVGIGVGVLVMGFLTQYVDIKLAFGVWSALAVIAFLYYRFAVKEHYRKSVITH
ncbi:MAG: MFS transporter [Bacteroidota bacterium]